jgi:hypothetical protein
MREWMYSSIILNFGNGREWSASHTGSFTYGEGAPPPYQLNARLADWVPNLVFTLWNTERSLDPVAN